MVWLYSQGLYDAQTQHGALISSTTRRPCVLSSQEKELVQVSGEDAAAIVQRIPLPGSVIDILWEDPPDDKERAFAVVKGDDTLITINSDTDDQMGEWVPVLTNLAQSN